MTRRSWPKAGLFSVLLTCIALAMVFGSRLSSQGRPPNGRTVIVDGREAVAGEVLVKFTRPVPSTDRVQFEQQLDSDISEQLVPNLRRLRSRRFDVENLIAFFRTRNDVQYVEPNYIIRADDVTTPNDPSFSSLWGLLNVGQVIGGQAGVAGADIHATSAWNLSVGSTANVVAVVDTGVDYNHPDLAGNIWSAPSQFTVTIGGANITCAAGTHGFNAISRTCNPMDDNNHGTHVSGTIGAVGNNNIGVAGVNWIASIMGAKFLGANGSGSTSDAIDAIEFTIQAKQRFGDGANVRVLSNSWGGGGYSQALLDEINKANTNDMLFVASAGNSGENTSTTPAYPASYNAPNIISVAASDNRDQLAWFSNYGPTVHLAAPGVLILSTTRNDSYAFYNGTSMAAPHVSGVAALVLSECALNTAGVKSAILNNLQSVPALSGWVATGGRLDANAAIGSCATPPGPQPPAAPTGLQATGGNAQVSLVWTGSAGATSYTVKRASTAGGTKLPLAAGTNIQGTSFTDMTAVNGTTYYYVVVANNAQGESSESNVASAMPTAPPAIPAPPTGLTASSPVKKQIKLTWNVSTGATSYIVKRAGVQIATVTTPSYTDKGLKSGTLYTYTVAARNSAGTSADSNSASGTAK